jgi:hypothetical protein
MMTGAAAAAARPLAFAKSRSKRCLIDACRARIDAAPAGAAAKAAITIDARGVFLFNFSLPYFLPLSFLVASSFSRARGCVSRMCVCALQCRRFAITINSAAATANRISDDDDDDYDYEHKDKGNHVRMSCRYY